MLKIDVVKIRILMICLFILAASFIGAKQFIKPVQASTAWIQRRSEILTIAYYYNQTIAANSFSQTGTDPWVDSNDGDTSYILSTGSSTKFAWLMFEDSLYVEWVNVTYADFTYTGKQDTPNELTNMYLIFWNYSSGAVLLVQDYINSVTWINRTHTLGPGNTWNPRGFHLTGYDVTLQINAMRFCPQMMVDHYVENYITYIQMNITGFAGPLKSEIAGVEIENYNAGEWCFVNEKYYLFNGTFWGDIWSNVTFAEMNFTLPTNEGNITSIFSYNGTSEEFGVNYTSDILDPVFITQRPTRFTAGPVSNISNQLLQVYWYIWFNPVCLDVWRVGEKVDVYARAFRSDGSNSSWIENADLFYLYSHGGFTYNTTIWGNDDAGRIVPGNQLEIWARNGSGIETDMWFNDLQHIKIRPEVYAICGYPSFYVRYNFDYYHNQLGWIEGLEVQLQAESITYGTERNWNWSIWWKYAAYSESPHYVYAFHTGDAAALGATSQTHFWLDIWFGRLNGSASVGGRFNAYQWPMRDSASDWLRWLNNNWGPDDRLVKESYVEYPLAVTHDGQPFSSQQIDMVRVRARLYVQESATYEQYVELRNYMVFELGQDGARPIDSIDTPTFEETATPVMPMGGWIGALFGALSYLGQFIAENIVYGGLNLWGNFVLFLDSIASWLGFPNAFTNFISWLGSGWAWIVDSFTYVILLITPFFVFVGSFLGKLLTVVAETATNWAAMALIFWNLLDGTFTAGINLFNDLGIASWITLGIILYPLHLLILGDEHGIDAVYKEINFIKDLIMTGVNLFLKLIQLIISLVSTIIESVPVVE